MRKYLIGMLLVWGVSTLQAKAQRGTYVAVREVLQQQQDAWNSGNLAGFMQGYWKSDSLQFIGKSGVTYGWQNTFDNYKKSYPDTSAMGQLTFTVLQVKPLGKSEAYVTGKWQLTRTKGNIGGYFTLLFRRINGAWVIVSDHTS
jgi:ketosteroid isomerase-like protein